MSDSTKFDNKWWTGKDMPRAAVSNRPLWVYAVDPSMAGELDTAAIHKAKLKIRWEEDEIKIGPVGEYLEVIDYDPASRCFYPPLDLNKREVLVQGGLTPSEGNPQFHQQMVYAVAMHTIQTFEKALGRRSMWARRKDVVSEKDTWAGYVKRLRIYPHAMRERNAYYDPQKKALLFGYFPAAEGVSSATMPGGTVFTCLSFDIVAHETTHALLDGLHPHFTEPSNIDVFAFHEAFADVVALFQHFQLRDLLAHQIAKTRGDLATENLLAELAQQFGRATGGHGALRDAIGSYDEEGRWSRSEPTGRELDGVLEPHRRGAVLVGAVFDAFVSIYNRRTADLIRLASGGSGVLRQGALHPDLVKRLADEASKAASHVLRICIRALDYCPPVDVDFGDYLRALVTADHDLVPEDNMEYRIAFIEAFRRRGIYPRGVRTLSEESLRWWETHLSLPTKQAREIREFVGGYSMRTKRGSIVWDTKSLVKGLEKTLTEAIGSNKDRDIAYELGIDRNRPFRIDSARPCWRTGQDGGTPVELTFDVHQAVVLSQDPEDRSEEWVDPLGEVKTPDGKFVFRGGSTVILGLEDMAVRYCISKNVLSEPRRERRRAFLARDACGLHELYLGEGVEQPFAMLHRDKEGQP